MKPAWLERWLNRLRVSGWVDPLCRIGLHDMASGKYYDDAFALHPMRWCVYCGKEWAK